MKRLFLLGMILTSGFLLSACDGFNQDTVDQLSEELCRENPTHELCSIENLDTAAESAVEELVLDAVEALKDGGSDVCDSIFAITNTDLLDDCKDGSLLPTGVTAFTVIEASKDGDSYIFKGSTATDAFLEIKVSVGTVDGNMRITLFETKTIEDPNPPAEVTAEEFIKEFFVDYQDDALTFDQVNAMYLNDSWTTEDETDRDETLSSDESYTITTIVMNDAGNYDVTYTRVYMGETTTEMIEIKVTGTGDDRYLEFVEEQDAECTVDCNEEPNPIDETTVELLFNAFILGYLNSAFTDEQLADVFLGGVMDDGFKESRAEDLANGTLIELLSVEFGEGDMYKIELQFTKGVDVTTQIVNIHVNMDGTTPVIVFDDMDNDCDGEVCYPDDLVTGEEAIAFINDYFMSLSEAGMSNQLFADIFFGGFLSSDFAMMRDDYMNDNATFEVLEIMFNEDGYFIVEYKMMIGDDIIVHKRPGRIRVQQDDLIVEWDQMIDDTLELDLTFATEFFTNFLRDYFDPLVTNEVINTTYFGGMDEFDMLEEREYSLEEDIQIVVLSVEEYDGYGTFIAILQATFEGEVEEEKVLFQVRRLEDNTPVFILVEDDEGYTNMVFDFETFEGQLIDFVNDYNNDGIFTDDFIMRYFKFSDHFEIIDQRMNDHSNGFVIELVSIQGNLYGEEGIFEVIFRATGPNGQEELRVYETILFEMNNEYSFMFYSHYDGKDNDCDGLDDSCEVVYNIDVATAYMQEFIDMYNDASVTKDQLYMHVYDYLAFLDDREMNMNDGLFWVLDEQVDMMHDGYFSFLLYATDGDVVIHVEIYVKIIEINNGFLLKSDDFNMNSDVVIDFDEFDQQLLLYINDYNDMNLSEQDFITNHFMYSDPYMTLEQRLMDYDNGLMLELYMIETNVYGEPEIFRVTFKLLDSDGLEVELRTLDMVLLSIDNQYSFIILEEHGKDDDCDGFGDTCEIIYDVDVAIGYMEEFIDMYNDASVSKDDLYMYILNYLPFLDERDMHLNEGLVWALEDYVEVLGDGYFIFNVKAELNGVEYYFDMVVRVYALEDTFLLQSKDYHVNQDVVTNINEFDQQLFVYIDDYNNMSLSEQDFITNHFMYTNPSMALEQRLMDHDNGLMLELFMIEPNMYGEPEIFRVTFKLLDSDGLEVELRTMDMVLLNADNQYSFFILEQQGVDDDCDMFSVCEPITDPTNLELFMVSFLAMYNDPSVTIDELAMYIDDDSFLLYDRDMFFEDGVFWTLNDPVEYMYDNYFLYRFEATIDGEMAVMDFVARVYFIGDGYYIVPERYDDVCEYNPSQCQYDPVIYDEQFVQDFFTDFLYSYVDSSWTFDELNQTFFMWNAPEYLEEHRAEFLVDNSTAEFLSLQENTMYKGFFDITYRMTAGSFVMDHTVTVRLVDLGQLTFEFFDELNVCHVNPDMCNEYQDTIETNIEVINPFVEELFSALNDENMMNDQIAAMYFLWGEQIPQMSYRNDSTLNPVYTLLTVEPSVENGYNGYFDVTFTITLDNEEPMLEDITLKFYYSEGKLLIEVMFDMDDYTETDLAIIEPLVQALFTDLNDESITIDEINETYFLWMMPASLIMDQGTGELAYVSLTPNTEYGIYSFFDITYHMTLADESVVTITLPVLFAKTEMGLIIIPVESEFGPESELEEFVYKFFDNVSAYDVTNDDICQYVDGASQSLCTSIYNYHHDNDYTVIVTDMIFYDDGTIEVMTLTENMDWANIEENTFLFTMNPDNDLFTISVVESDNPLYTE